MIQKQNYVAPAAECLSVKFERNFLDSDDYSTPGSNPNLPGDNNQGGF